MAKKGSGVFVLSSLRCSACCVTRLCERIERSAIVLEALAHQSATRLATQIEHVPITSAEDFETMTRCVNELVRSQLLVGKSLLDLRQLRAAAAAGFGEIIPPSRADGSPEPSAQERVLSNF